MALATLSVDLVAKLAAFEADLGKAARATEQSAQRMAKAIGVATSALGGLAAGVSLAAINGFIRDVVSGVDALNDLKDATGASIENISALEDVAARTGTSFDSVGTALVKFNAALNDAKPGSDAERAFQALGLSVKELKALDPAEALRQTAVALARFADDGNKARLTQELFGKSLREVAPFLNDLATQGALVAKVTAEQAAEAEKFNQQLDQLAKNSKDAHRALVGDLVVGINAAARAFRESGLADAFKTLFFGDEQYRSNVQLVNLTDRLLAAEKALGEARKAGLSEDSPVVKRSRAGVAAIQAEINALQKLRAVSDPNNQSAAETARLGRRQSAPDISLGGGKAAKPTFVEAITTDLDRYLETLQRSLEKEQELTEVQKAQIRISEAGAQGFSEAQRNAILTLAKRVDLERDLKREREDLLKQAQELDAALIAGDQEAAKRLQSLLDATPGAALEKARKDQLLLAEAFERGQISEQQYLEAAAARAGITQQGLEKTKSLAEELGLTFTSAFEDAIVGGKKFSDVLKGLQQDLLRIVVRKTVTEPLGGWISGQIGGLLKGLLPSADGGGYTGGGARAGGMDGKGGFLAMLHPRETIVDHTKGQSAGGAVSIVINQTYGDLVTGDMLRKSQQQLARQIQGAIASSVTRGGALA